MWRRIAPRLASSLGVSENFATKAAAEAAGDVQLPLKLYGVPGRYASALFVTASKAKKLDLVEKELKTIASMVNKSSAFKNYLGDPTVLRTKKSKGIAELMKEFKVSDLTKNLFVIMAENGRLAHTEKVAESFNELLMASRGEVKGTVVSADPLTPEQMKRIRSSITKFVDKGAT
eukprot:jgi/Pico_ML_1/54144/g4562.t1